MTELVSGLLARLEELEAHETWHKLSCLNYQVEHLHPCECAVPNALVRLCRAHRDLINAYGGAVFTQHCHPEYVGNNGYAQAMRDTLRILARGLGVEDKEN